MVSKCVKNIAHGHSDQKKMMINNGFFGVWNLPFIIFRFPFPCAKIHEPFLQQPDLLVRLSLSTDLCSLTSIPVGFMKTTRIWRNSRVAVLSSCCIKQVTSRWHCEAKALSKHSLQRKCRIFILTQPQCSEGAQKHSKKFSSQFDHARQSRWYIVETHRSRGSLSGGHFNVPWSPNWLYNDRKRGTKSDWSHSWNPFQALVVTSFHPIPSKTSQLERCHFFPSKTTTHSAWDKWQPG